MRAKIPAKAFVLEMRRKTPSDVTPLLDHV